FHRVFDRDDVHALALDLIDHRVQGRRFSRARRPRHENYAFVIPEQGADRLGLAGVQAQGVERLDRGAGIEDADHDLLAQRLMRRLCQTCKEVWMEAPPEKLKRWLPTGTPLYRAAGCPDCAMTGYRGRFSILEVLTMSPEVERTIAGGETADKVATIARRHGMKSLWESGLSHVLKGESTIDELMRVVDVPQEEAPPVQVPPPPGPRQRGSAASRGVQRPAEFDSAEPEAPAEPVSVHFDLLEEPAQPPTSGPHGVPACKVLLVDDEDSLRKVMKDLLERDGYLVSEARDGVQALDQIDRVGPDIIVLDLNLPGLDGYGVLSHLRSRPATASIPVIVLTAKGDEDNEVRVFELGADDFLTKPFRARALSARLEAVLGRRRH
ncbi:MAG: response regulator, partial [Chloroflexi bacterium]